MQAWADSQHKAFGCQGVVLLHNRGCNFKTRCIIHVVQTSWNVWIHRPHISGTSLIDLSSGRHRHESATETNALSQFSPPFLLNSRVPAPLKHHEPLNSGFLCLKPRASRYQRTISWTVSRAFNLKLQSSFDDLELCLSVRGSTQHGIQRTSASRSYNSFISVIQHNAL